MKISNETISQLTLPPGKSQLVVWDDKLPGFGVVIGRRKRTFVVEARVEGRKRRIKIGVLGELGGDRMPWTATLARDEAKTIVGDMAAGRLPDRPSAPRGAAGGPTLRDALDAHLARMRKKQRAERSIETLESEVKKYLAPWLDRPITDLTGAQMIELHEAIKAGARARAGSNRSNAKGAPLANRVIASVSACWNSLNRKLEGSLGNWNPAKAVDRDVLKPKRERVADDQLPAWWATVQTLSPVRRDLQIFCMFTGMRSEAARHVRWEHVNLATKSLSVPAPKGGEAKAFSLPLGPTLVELLQRRRRDNAERFEEHGGDAGFVFPSLSRARPFVVQPIAEVKERRLNAKTGMVEKYVSGPHVSRRTYLSVAAESGIGELDRSVLANHAFGRHSVNQSYIEQAFPHLLDCQTKIDAALWARIRPAWDGHPGLPTAHDAIHASTSARA